MQDELFGRTFLEYFLTSCLQDDMVLEVALEVMAEAREDRVSFLLPSLIPHHPRKVVVMGVGGGGRYMYTVTVQVTKTMCAFWFVLYKHRIEEL